jgi:hypothetical protein
MESCDGLPGYDVELTWLEFQSSRYRNLSEISEYVKGNLLQRLFQRRADMLIQSPDVFNYGQDRFDRTNTYDAHCREPVIKGKVLTLQYVISWHGARSAHPHHFYQTFSFVLEPLFLMFSLEDIFADPSSSLTTLQTDVREQLILLDPEWVRKGTEKWDDFCAFVFGAESLQILFAPYHVAAYACGPQFADVPYARFAALMRPEYRGALQIEHLVYETQDR